MAQASEIKKQYKKRTLFQETWRRLTKNRGAMLGLAFLVILVLAAAFSRSSLTMRRMLSARI